RFFRHRSVSRLLTTNPVFSGLSTRDHAALEGRFRFLEVDAGAELLTAGQVPEGLIGLLSGQAEVVVGQVAVARLGPGDLMGEMSLMSGAPAMGTVRAVTRCYAVQMSAADFARILGARPQARAYLEEVAARRRSATEAVLARTEGDGSARKVVF
ncbi:MAG: cyclic nucleotide-binding domain-containing protein, partial [Myxococcales bacterium]|nr:cyclic nucleotide-binding domain-containing protein [Myxococcales bacterium]